jgi:HK97 family phage portal protein
MLLDLLTGRRARSDISTSHELMEHLTGGQPTQAGVNVNPDTAMRASAVYSAIRVLAEGVAQLPLVVYRRRADGGRERANQHWLFELLHDRPNQWQTSFEWREMLMGHVALRGNHYSWKNLVDRGRQVRELVPLHPDRMEVEQLDDFSLRYHYTTPDGRSRTFGQDEILHIRGLSDNGVVGMNPIAYQRESIGHYLAAERHGASFFGNGAFPGAAFKHPGQLSPQAHENLKRDLQEDYGGGNSGKPILLEEGMDWQQLSVSNEDSQFLETYKHKRTEIAAIFRVPPHMIGDLERATFSNIEQQSLDFVVYTLMPWLRRIEQAILRDLVPDNQRASLYAEHLVEGLLRGDMAARKDFYASAINWGWMSPNEVREKENMNPRDGGDEYMIPGNVNVQDENGNPVAPGGNDAAT